MRGRHLKQTYRLGAQNWRRAVPLLPSYKQWLTRGHPYCPTGWEIVGYPCPHALRAARLSLLDSKPIPLCLPICHGRVRLLRDEGADFRKTSTGWCCGFQLPLLRPIDGRVLKVVLTPGNSKDRLPALSLIQTVDGRVTLGDWGSRGPEGAAALAEEAERLLITRDQAPTHRSVLSQVRHQVETPFSQLWRKFVDRVFSRSWSGLWNPLQLKVLYSNLCHAGVLAA